MAAQGCQTVASTWMQLGTRDCMPTTCRLSRLFTSKTTGNRFKEAASLGGTSYKVWLRCIMEVCGYSLVKCLAEDDLHSIRDRNKGSQAMTLMQQNVLVAAAEGASLQGTPAHLPLLLGQLQLLGMLLMLPDMQ